ncbi:MAG: hypothetical protein K9G75_04615 [Candidatus Nanopelagicales bacterium]|nr:hypothetical protein [Candidatus Nanopelagicales bacterium]
MGLFSRKGAPSKAGSYSTSWPAESGLGRGPYSVEAEQQEAYLIYTPERRARENVPAEDMAVMTRANTLLFEMSAGTPVNEVPLIQGPVDVEWSNPALGDQEFAAQMLITDRRVLLWWEKMRAMSGSLVILDHLSMVPRSETRRLTPYMWTSGIIADYPISTPPQARQFERAMFTVGVHFSNDGHSNRRSRSVQATLNELEDRYRQGLTGF